jgi:hypothetical protein
MNGPIVSGSGYLWYNQVDKGSGVTDSLGNLIEAIQTGTNSIDAMATTILAVIETEKSALPLAS